MVGHMYFQQTQPLEFLTWELGYIFNPLFQNNQGIGDAGFQRYFVIHRVMAHCNPENIASWKVLERIGMRREGHFRRNIFFKTAADGTPLWVDTFEYAILKDDIK